MTDTFSVSENKYFKLLDKHCYIVCTYIVTVYEVLTCLGLPCYLQIIIEYSFFYILSVIAIIVPLASVRMRQRC